MSGSARTKAYLDATSFVTGQSAGIGSDDLRDLTASGPQWDVVSSAAAPGILRGSVSVIDYLERNGGVMGAVGAGGGQAAQRTTNGTQFQAASDYAAANGKFLEFPPGTIEINNASGILWTTSAYANFRYVGTMESNISQYATGPVLTIGDTTSQGNGVDHCMFEGMQLYYLGAASTTTPVLQIGQAVSCSFKGFNLYGAFNAGHLLMIGETGHVTNTFSCDFENFSGNAATQSVVNVQGYATGNLFKNFYFTNNNAGAQPCVNPFIFANGYVIDESVFDRLNLEHFTTNSLMNINAGGSIFLDAHFENIQMTGANPNFWNLANGVTHINLIGGTTLDLAWNTGQMSGTGRYIFFYDNPTMNIYGHRFRTTGSPPQSTNAQFVLFFQDTGSGAPNSVPRSNCYIESLRTSQMFQGYLSIDSSTARTTYGDIEHIQGYNSMTGYADCMATIIDDPPDLMVIYGAMGQRITVRYITALAASRTLVLSQFMTSTGAGSAVQRGFGDQVQIIREASCTGSFTITVKNATSGGTTVGTFTTSSAGTSQQFAYKAVATGTWAAPAWATA